MSARPVLARDFAADHHRLIGRRPERYGLVVLVIDFVPIATAELAGFLVALANVIHGGAVEAEALLAGGRHDWGGCNATSEREDRGDRSRDGK